MRNIPAFPRPFSKNDFGDFTIAAEEQDGMTLRDWFAGQALVGMFASRLKDPNDWEDIAMRAYIMADAMMEERTDEGDA